MASEKINFSKLSKNEAAAFLREVADCLEGTETFSSALSLLECSDFKQLKITIKQKHTDDIHLKIKSKPINYRDAISGDKPADFHGIEKPKYKKLKKKIKEEFTLIHEALSANLMPDVALMKSFLLNSELMVSYGEKYGAIYYAPYESTCTRFRAAYESDDLLSVKAIYQELSQIKTACHQEYR